MVSDSHSEDQDRQENRPFIKETVITEDHTPSFGKKLLRTAVLAVCFGVIAAASFHFMQRHLDKITPEPSTTAVPVSFAHDSNPADSSDAETTASGETRPSSAETIADPTNGTGQTDAQPWDTWQEDVLSLINAHNLGINDYKQLYVQMNSVCSSAQRSMVVVTATNRENSLFQDEHSYDTSSFGVIVYRTSSEVLILTPYSSTMQLSENSTLSVTFANLQTCDAYIKATDGTADLMLLAVSSDQIPDSTNSAISVMLLGNSYVANAGQPIIAMGAPVGGIIKSYNYGMLTYVENNVSAPDNTISLLHTNLIGDETSRGFLIDLDGRLIGWIDSELLSGGTLTAVGISDLKTYIENLSNGYFGCYLGIEGLTLTNDIKAALDTTLDGVIISRCLENSPAQAAGLQSGDIITAVGGTLIRSINDLRAKLLSFTTEQTITITVQRLGGRSYREITYDVRLERR